MLKMTILHKQAQDRDDSQENSTWNAEEVHLAPISIADAAPEK